VKQANNLAAKKLNDKDLPQLFQAMGVALTAFPRCRGCSMLGAPMEEGLSGLCGLPLHLSPLELTGNQRTYY
jgi:hypothetical protein